MAATPEQARINGRKGGRPKAAHTLQAEHGKAMLIQAYLDNIQPINQALVDKAKAGDIAAIKELHDRVHGKAPQAMEFTGEIKNINIEQLRVTIQQNLATFRTYNQRERVLPESTEVIQD